MANVNAPFGLKPIRHKNGTPWNGGLSERKILLTYATSIFRGDLVQAAATGYVNRSAAAEAVRIGVFWDCYYYDLTIARWVRSKYYPASVNASGDIVCNLILDPSVLYEIQGDSADVIERVEQEDIFANADIVATAGDTLSGQSRETLDTSGIAVTATFPLRIHELHPADADSAYRRAVVSLNSLEGVAYLGV